MPIWYLLDNEPEHAAGYGRDMTTYNVTKDCKRAVSMMPRRVRGASGSRDRRRPRCAVHTRVNKSRREARRSLQEESKTASLRHVHALETPRDATTEGGLSTPGVVRRTGSPPLAADRGHSGAVAPGGDADVVVVVVVDTAAASCARDAPVPLATSSSSVGSAWRQTGHEWFSSSQRRMASLRKTWPHGSTVAVSPSPKGSLWMAHSHPASTWLCSISTSLQSSQIARFDAGDADRPPVGSAATSCSITFWRLPTA
mmetsp:Transcript_1356/g.5236  ORF Transcript_1356/g.5236 Transcript_1356/m.5236 type:complete len:256 (+) Transcript_1356:56-823(+)